MRLAFIRTLGGTFGGGSSLKSLRGTRAERWPIGGKFVFAFKCSFISTFTFMIRTTAGTISGRGGGSTGRVLSGNWEMYPEGRPEGALPLLGMRGRLGSEQGPVGGGCCGRVDAACDEWRGCADPADGWKGRGGMMEGDGARAVRGKVSGVGLVDGMSGSRLPDMTVSAGMIRRKAVGEKSRLCLRASAVASSLWHWWVAMCMLT